MTVQQCLESSHHHECVHIFPLPSFWKHSCTYYMTNTGSALHKDIFEKSVTDSFHILEAKGLP